MQRMPTSPVRAAPTSPATKRTIPIASVVDPMATPSSSLTAAAAAAPAVSPSVTSSPSSSATAAAAAAPPAADEVETTTAVPAATAAVAVPVGADATKPPGAGGLPPPHMVGHIIYQCDNCLKHPIQKFRYRCKQCAEYDLCPECHGEGKHDPKHLFEKIPTADIPKPHILTQGQPMPGGGAYPVQQAPAAPMFTTGATMDAARPPRRSASTSKGSSENSIERMDEVLARSHVGPLPASHSSSGIASQFLDLYDAGLVALERHKKGRPQEQINARIAMALVGIPLRARRGGNFVARTVPQPVDQETVTGVMAALVTQLSVLDADKVFSTSAPGAVGEENEQMDLEKLKGNVERGVYFRRVESPVLALTVFQRHMFRIWANGTKSGATEDQCHKFDKWSRQALDEVRDGLGLPAQFESAEQDDGGGGEGVVAPMAAMAATGSADRASPEYGNGVKRTLSASATQQQGQQQQPLKKSHKKKRPLEEMEQSSQQYAYQQQQQQQQGQPIVVVTPQGQMMQMMGTMMAPPPAMQQQQLQQGMAKPVGSSRVDLQACKLEYSIVSPK